MPTAFSSHHTHWTHTGQKHQILFPRNSWNPRELRTQTLCVNSFAGIPDFLPQSSDLSAPNQSAELSPRSQSAELSSHPISWTDFPQTVRLALSSQPSAYMSPPSQSMDLSSPNQSAYLSPANQSADLSAQPISRLRLQRCRAGTG